jgi:hypothetical protein
MRRCFFIGLPIAHRRSHANDFSLFFNQGRNAWLAIHAAFLKLGILSGYPTGSAGEERATSDDWRSCWGSFHAPTNWLMLAFGPRCREHPMNAASSQPRSIKMRPLLLTQPRHPLPLPTRPSQSPSQPPTRFLCPQAARRRVARRLAAGET